MRAPRRVKKGVENAKLSHPASAAVSPATSVTARQSADANQQHVEVHEARVLAALRRQDIETSRAQMTDLVECQLRNGDKRVAVACLRSLAEQAEEFGLVALCETWRAEATRLDLEVADEIERDASLHRPA